MVETTYYLNTPIRLALLSDSHNTPCGQILRSLQRRRPDMITIAGDFVHGYAPADPKQLKMEESTAAMELLNGCSALAATYVSLGNHEWMLNKEDLQLIESTGCRVLDNTYTTIQPASSVDEPGKTAALSPASRSADRPQICIGGLTSAKVTGYRAIRSSMSGKDLQAELYPRPASSSARLTHGKPDLDWLDGFERSPGYHILLCHHPEYYPNLLRDRSPDLILCGHAHGGQWRIAGHGLFAPGQGLFPRYTSGVYEDRLVVSRGLCNTAVFPRINNPTEIVYIERSCREP